MGFIKKTLAKAKKAIRSLKSNFDKGGAYTGDPSDGCDRPEQDADDL